MNKPMNASGTPETSTGGGSKRSKRKILGMIGGALLVFILVASGGVFAASENGINKSWSIEPVALAVKPSPEMAERGKAVATFRGCRDCHGEDLSGRLVADAMPVMILAGPNITAGGMTKTYSDEDWARVVRHGIKPNGKAARFMPSYEFTELSHEDLAAIIAYARSVPAVATPGPAFEVGPLGRVLYLSGELPLIAAETIEHDLKPANPVPAPTKEYGRYLAASCSGCHGAGLSGGKIPGVGPDWPMAANLTQHESGLRKWSFEEFKTTLRTGKTPDGRELKAPYMPWQNIAESSDDDLRALWEYARSVEPRPHGNR
jgi:mono/diheme cytochrome c family protein